MAERHGDDERERARRRIRQENTDSPSTECCPRCGSTHFGGAVINDTVPTWRCLECDHSWPRITHG